MRELPTGTVTFLFTDIQGSTPLWKREPETMAVALEPPANIHEYTKPD
jgi:class 3 adenylate cyclase